MDRTIDQYFSKDQANCIKGLLAMSVVACHARNFMTSLNDTIPGMILTAVGYLAVAAFFFFSGYGLELQRTQRGERFLKEFPLRRVLPLYVVYVFSESFYTLYSMALSHQTDVLSIWLRALIGRVLVNVYDWYLQAALLVYILYYLGCRFSPKGMKSAMLVIGLVVYILVSYQFLDGMLYCQSILGFPIGVLLYHYREIFDRCSAGKRYWLALILVFAAFSVTLLVGNLCIGPSWFWFSFKYLSSAVFPLLMILLVKKIRISYKVTRWLGERFSELYIAQGVPIALLRSSYIWIGNDFCYLLAVWGVTAMLATVFHPVLQWLQRCATGGGRK